MMTWSSLLIKSCYVYVRIWSLEFAIFFVTFCNQCVSFVTKCECWLQNASSLLLKPTCVLQCNMHIISLKQNWLLINVWQIPKICRFYHFCYVVNIWFLLIVYFSTSIYPVDDKQLQNEKSLLGWSQNWIIFYLIHMDFAFTIMMR